MILLYKENKSLIINLKLRRYTYHKRIEKNTCKRKNKLYQIEEIKKVFTEKITVDGLKIILKLHKNKELDKKLSR